MAKSTAEVRTESVRLSVTLSPQGTLVGEPSIVDLEDYEVSKGNTKALLRKIDRNLIPIITALYLLSWLDFSNLDNAKENGLTKDLRMTGKDDFNIAVSVFFPSYLISQIPSNLVMRAWRPSLWVPSLMLGWAMIITCMGFVRNFAGLLVARVFLGLFEGGVFPGIVYFISMWYQSHECGLRIAMMYSVAVAGDSFNDLVGNAILRLDGRAGLGGWCWLFIMEGSVTLVAALVAFRLMQDYPESATFLTPFERRLVMQRIDEEQGSMPKNFRLKYVKDALTDWKIWVHMLVTLGVTVPMFAISQFLPGIIEEMGYQGVQAKLMGIPPRLVASAFVLAGGFAADRHEQRGVFIIGFCLIGMVGFSILGTAKSLEMEYVATFLIAIGTFPIVPQDVAWNANNIGGSTKRAVGIAMQIGLGNLGEGLAGFIICKENARRFVSGHGILLGMMGLEQRERGDRASFFVLTT
ncbi:uncharacterized protein UV8b_05384 [Ustilaginoidea virens]|uniref:Major facilitator superfamily (MFS) profile domain-containing protein n=1 Tax=Ustilaginoidea virens TaxID=1159556 RepID=A0A8E5MIV5_USTVR|nr:uncharacterized protein UV8b_05384 [Ustilaginoidea virens]QUC21141.1 hypothetical protein UV8b_05384 [Ustilaginoidea virens]